MALSTTNAGAPVRTGRGAPGLADYGLLFFLASIFGAAFMLIALALQSFPRVTVVVVRQGLATLIFLSAMIWAGQRFPAIGKVWLYIAGATIIGNALPFFLVAWGQ